MPKKKKDTAAEEVAVEETTEEASVGENEPTEGNVDLEEKEEEVTAEEQEAESPEALVEEKAAEESKKEPSTEELYRRRSVDIDSRTFVPLRGRRQPADRIAIEMGLAVKEDEERKEEINELVMAANSVPPTIMHGIMTGITSTPNGDCLVLVSRCRENGESMIPIKIPVEMFFVYNNKKAMNLPILQGDSSEETKKYIQNELLARIGSKVEFTIQKVVAIEDEAGNPVQVAYGNRLKAMEIRCRNNYLTIPRGEELPIISEGMIVSALVTGVRKDRIRVNVMGAETTIHSEELSHTTLESLDREFEVGDAFEVKVSDIQEYEHVAFGNTFHLVTLKASKKATTIHPNKKYFNQFQVGDISRGVIKAVNEGVYVLLNDKVLCRCNPPAVGMPVVGEPCSVQITYKKEEDYRIGGRILHM